MSENETPRRSDDASPPTYRVSITLTTGDVVAVRLEDAHHPSAMIALPAGFGLGMPVGFETNLVLRDLDGERIEYQCTVRSRRSSDETDLYELKLTSGSLADRRRLYKHGANLSQRRTDATSLLYETRKTFRVQPDKAQRAGIALGIQCGGELGARYPVTLGDVSLTGLSVAVEPRTEDELATVDQVLIHFEPCFFGHVVAYPARIRYRVVGPRGIRYGLEFAGPDSLDYKRFQLLLTDYVMRRQREILQGKSG